MFICLHCCESKCRHGGTRCVFALGPLSYGLCEICEKKALCHDCPVFEFPKRREEKVMA